MNDGRRYDAFISYRRSDGSRIARWLRNRLQTYRPPKRLRRAAPPLNIYLDTSYETATTNFYDDNILPALQASDRLIVIATPACMQPGVDGGPNWVVREISDFRTLPQQDRVLVAIGGDLPEGSLPGALDRTFPHLERVDLRAAGTLGPFTFARRARLHEEFLKIAAPLWGIKSDEMPLLRQEEARRRLQRLSLVLASTVALLLAMTALLIWGTANLASARRQLAANHLAQGQNAVHTAPAEARLHLLRALEIAESSRIPWLRLDVEAARARAWLGVHYRDTTTRVLRHPDVVQWTRFDPASRRLATAGTDGVIRLWEDGRLLAESPKQRAPLMWLAFDARGGRVAFATDHPDARIATWDLRTKRIADVIRGELLRPQYGPGHDDVIAIAETQTRLRLWSIDGGFQGPPIGIDLSHSVVLSPQADYAAVTGEGRLTLWRIATGVRVAELPYAPINGAVTFSRDGRRLAVPIAETAMQVFDTASGRAVGDAITVPRLLSYAALDRDGSRLVIVWSADDNVSPQRHLHWMTVRAVASRAYLLPPQQLESVMMQPRFLLHTDAILTVERAEVRLWTLMDGLAVARHAPGDQLLDLDVHEPSGTVAAITASGGVAILDLRTLEPLRTRIDHTGSVHGAKFSGDGLHLATFGIDRTVRVARTRRSAAVTLLRQGSSVDHIQLHDAIQGAAISRDGRVIAAASGRGVDVWLDGKGPKRVLACAALAVAFAVDGRLAAGCRDRGAWIFNARGDDPRRIPGTREAQCVSFTPDGRQLLTCGHGRAWLWDLPAGTAALAIAHPRAVRNAAISPDGQWIVTVGEDHTTVIRDRYTGLARSPHLSAYAAFDVAFSPDSRMLATSGTAARVWEVPSGRPLTAELRNPNMFRSVAFSPDGTRLLAAGLNGEGQVWDVRTSRPDGPALADRGAMWTAAFSADGSRIITGTFEQRVTLWDASSKRPIIAPLNVGGPVMIVTFDAAGHRVLIGTAFGRLLLWDVSPAVGHPATLRRVAELDSARTIDEATGLVRVLPLSP
jgi:WD40 repeat protein